MTIANRLLADNRGKRFCDAYVLLKTISYGATSTVHLVQSKSTDQIFAAKIMHKRNRAYQPSFASSFRFRLLHEVAAMKIVESHPNAPRLVDIFEDEKHFILVMEYYSGGELFDHIVEGQKIFTEREAADIMKQIMEFLDYCHSLGLVHADLKPENIVLSDEGSIKVLDFGMSVFCRAHESLRNVFGTINYCSPEMAKNWCGQKTDIWSAGVMLYFMLSGHPPFANRNKEAVLCRLRQHPTIYFNKPVWDEVSDEAKKFIRMLLNPDVDQRPTAKEALQHEWLSDLSVASKSGFALDSETIELLKMFSQRSMMKRMLWLKLVKFLPEEYSARQRRQFNDLDLDKNGVIDLDELRSALVEVTESLFFNLIVFKAMPDLEDDELKAIFKAIDVNQSGEIDMTEFIAATFASLEPKCRIDIARLSFMEVDPLGKGHVEKEELIQFLMVEASESMKQNCKHEFLNEISSMDIDGDGQISAEEFQTAIMSNV